LGGNRGAAPKKPDSYFAKTRHKIKAGRNPCPLRYLDGPKWPAVVVLVYFPEVVDVLAGCEFALGMLTYPLT
jgi:hypothetical protein